MKRLLNSRNYGLDLMRVIAMCGIIILHFQEYGGLISSVQFLSANYFVVMFLQIISVCSVNCFGILSGFVGYDIQWKSIRIVRLSSIAVFYSVLITLLFVVISPGTIPRIVIFKSFIPYIYKHNWYFIAYFVLFFFIPYLNSMVRNLTLRNNLKLCITIFLLYSVLPTFFQKDLYLSNNGFSPLWLAFLYIGGAVLKKYRFDSIFTKKGKSIGYFCFAVLLIFIVKICLRQIVLFLGGGNTTVFQGACWYITSYPSPFVLFMAFCLFFAFSNIECGNSLRKILDFVVKSLLSGKNYRD